MKKLLAFAVAVTVLAGAFTACGVTPPKINPATILGEKYLAELDYEQALPQFEQAIQTDRKNPRGYFGKAAAEVGLGRRGDAAKSIGNGAKHVDKGLSGAFDDIRKDILISDEDAYISVSTAYDLMDWTDVAYQWLKRVSEKFPHMRRLAAEVARLAQKLGVAVPASVFETTTGLAATTVTATTAQPVTATTQITTTKERGSTTTQKQTTTKKITTTKIITTTTTTKPPTTTEEPGIKGVLNRASLIPGRTGYILYDSKIESIVGSGTTYEKVRRCYMWLIDNVTYDDHAPYGNTGDYNLNEAYGPLFAGRGSCKNYAAATFFLLRHIGLSTVGVVDGSIVNKDGRRQYHIWNIVILEGVRYIVDAEVEDKVYSKNGGSATSYFFANPATYKKYPQYYEGAF